MSTHWKYIVFDARGHLPESAFIFPPWESHRTVADGRAVLSAGFIRVTPSGVELFGESDSLGIKAEPAHAMFFDRLVQEP